MSIENKQRELIREIVKKCFCNFISIEDANSQILAALEQQPKESTLTDETRQTLIEYDKYMSSHHWGDPLLTPEQAVDEFLNQR